MQRLYYFNPDTDLALANNDPNFMSPQAIRWLAKDLALLPIWYAQRGSVVLVDQSVDKIYLDYLKSIFDLDVHLLLESEIISDKLDLQLYPWGWNLAVRRKFERLGFPEAKIKSVDQIDMIRNLSSRVWMKSLLNALPHNSSFCGQSQVLISLDDLLSLAIDLDRFLLKAPFSGSGRGLKWCRYGLDKASLSWCDNTIKQQKSVIAEPIYERVEDFAMEFELVDSTQISFIGYSYFKTTDNGVYLGNHLLSDDEFRLRIEREYFEDGFLFSVRQQLMKVLLAHYGQGYRGVLGVDMMVCKATDESFKLHPCVEVNLRMNMGVVARFFYERFVREGKQGRFAVDFSKTQGETLAMHIERQNKYPLVLEKGKIISGYLSLSAVTSESQCQAWVIVE